MPLALKTPLPRLLIVVPVYNHAASLAAVLRDLLELKLPVLVVDDGSVDAIEPVLQAFSHVPRVRHAFNQGKGAALVTAMKYAAEHDYQAILSFDADGQHLAQDVPRLMAIHQAHPTALVIGARDFDSPASGDVTKVSKFGRSFSNFWIWLETGMWLADTQTGLRIYPVDLALLAAIRGRRYSFEVEILSRSLWSGRTVLTVPVQVFYPPRAERISHFKPFHDNFRLTKTHSYLCTLRILQKLGCYDPRQSQRASQEFKGAAWSARVIAKMGATFAYVLMIFPVLSAFLFRSRERAGILAYYAQVHPEWSPGRRLRAAFSNYWYFAASIVDRLAPDTQGLIPAAMGDHKLISGRFPPAASIMVGAHYGDWFLIARQASALSQETFGIVLDPSVTPEFFAALEQNLAGKLRIISPRQGLLGFSLAVKEVLDEGGRVCFMIDRPHETSRAIAVEAPFFSGKAWVLRTPFSIAARLGVPVHFICARKQGPGAKAPYRIVAQEIWNGQEPMQEEALAFRAMEILESRVREAPQHWFNFQAFWH